MTDEVEAASEFGAAQGAKDGKGELDGLAAAVAAVPEGPAPQAILWRAPRFWGGAPLGRGESGGGSGPSWVR